MDKGKRSELISVLTISVLFIIVNVIWIWLFRRGQLFDIDEAGYFSISLVYFHAFMAHGFIGWLKAIESPGIQAPATTALTSLVYVIFGPRIFTGFFVIILSGIVTIIASYYLGKVVGGRRLALITAILVATSPIIINYARDYNFALPAAAVTTIALLAMVCSDHFANIKWAIIFGICLGLMPLTRTMTIAFIPGLVVAAAICTVSKSDNRQRRLSIMGMSLIIGIAIAAIWLIPSGPLVLHYLASFGYGSRVAEYARASHQSQGLLRNLTSWKETIQYFIEYIYLPDLAFILTGFALLLIAFARVIFTKGWRQAGLVILSSKMLPLVLLVVEGLLAITSSQNKGSGFQAPILPAMLLISAWAMLQLSSRRSWNLIVVGIIIIVSTMSLVPLLYLTAPTARTCVVNVPFLGLATVTDGRGVIQIYESGGGYNTQNPDVPINPQTAKLWIDESATTSQRLTQLNGSNAVTAFGFRNYLYNVNTVNLQQLLEGQSELPVTQVDPEVTGDSKAGYVQWLTNGDSAKASLLLTASGSQGDFFPVVTDKYMAAAALASGFFPIAHWSLPGGQRTVTLWKRTLK
jgi:4-amino-4-deoxy-L-arabinose transferase-like glycosyltransferase